MLKYTSFLCRRFCCGDAWKDAEDEKKATSGEESEWLVLFDSSDKEPSDFASDVWESFWLRAVIAVHKQAACLFGCSACINVYN